MKKRLLPTLAAFWEKHQDLLLPVMVVVGAAIYYCAISLIKHNNYASTMDIGLFNQTIRGYSRFAMVPNTISQVPTLLAEHFHPILMLLAPLYWIWDNERVLLLVQGIALAVSSFPIYLLAKERLNSISSALGIQLAYLAFWGMIGGTIYDFHEVALAVPLISFAIYCMVKQKDRSFWILFLLGLLVKEDIPLIFFMFGFYFALVQRRWKMGALVCLVSFAYYAVVIHLLSSGYFGAPYKFWKYEALGPDSRSALSFVFHHPRRTLAIFFDNPMKKNVISLFFKPWLFLPLLSPITLISLPTFAERFLSSNSAYWQTYYHYSLTISPILALGTVDALGWIKKLLQKVKLPNVLPLVTYAFLLVGLPITTANFLSDYKWVALKPEVIQGITRCLRQIPSDAPVAASNGLVSHLASRKEIYVLRNTDVKAEYIALDRAATPEVAPYDLKRYITEHLAKDYQVVCLADPVLVLHKGTPQGNGLSSDIQAYINAIEY